VLCAGAFAGWFFYQMRDMHTLASAQISDSLFVIEGTISNMYLVKCDGGYAAFDAGDDPVKIAKGCETLAIDPSLVRAVFVTHSDADHVDGLPAFPSARVYLAKEEIPLLKDKTHRHFMGMGHKNKLPVSKYYALIDGDSVQVGGISVHVIATPGHTLGSTCYRVGNSLFTGDLCLVVNDQIRPMVDLFTEDMAMDSASIRKIAGLHGIRKIFTAHSGYTANLENALVMWR
jgi:hydroxyacylglutathione hydrolase